MEKIALRIQQTFKNGSLIVDSLENDAKQGPAGPTRQRSVETDVDARQFEQTSFDKLYDK